MILNKKIFVETMTRKDTLSIKNTPILEYTIEYPKFISRNDMVELKRINQFYEKNAKAYEKYIRTALYKDAVADYHNSIKNGYPIHKYEIMQTFEVTYNQSCALSLYMQRYQYTGGAHGITPQTSQTWDLNTGRQLSLKDLFPRNPNYIADLKQEINRQIAEQIKQGNNYYFENYKELVNETFNPESFYLTPKALAIYFQQYDIAPYATGIPTFLIPYRQVNATLPICRRN